MNNLIPALVSVLFLAGCVGANSTPPSASQPGALKVKSTERPRTVPTYTVLHNFGGNGDGLDPLAGLVSVKGVLYGTTNDGGYNGEGTVYSITPSGTESVLHSFGASDGGNPAAPLINVNGTLYGATVGKGAKDSGTVYSITPSGKEAILYSFQGRPEDGSNPLAGLINVNGTLYGTTEAGGSGKCFRSSSEPGCGTVFSVTLAGLETVLCNFKGVAPKHGAFPYAGVVNVNGTLYGTTDLGGANDQGTVYSLTPSGTETVLHSFGATGDGKFPQAGLVNVKGTLYGTTWKGGANDIGTVFSVTPSGKETVLHSFAGSGDGEYPEAGLIDIKGTLYGTTLGRRRVRVREPRRLRNGLCNL